MLVSPGREGFVRIRRQAGEICPDGRPTGQPAGRDDEILELVVAVHSEGLHGLKSPHDVLEVSRGRPDAVRVRESERERPGSRSAMKSRI